MAPGRSRRAGSETRLGSSRRLTLEDTRPGSLAALRWRRRPKALELETVRRSGGSRERSDWRPWEETRETAPPRARSPRGIVAAPRSAPTPARAELAGCTPRRTASSAQDRAPRARRADTSSRRSVAARARSHLGPDHLRDHDGRGAEEEAAPFREREPDDDAGAGRAGDEITESPLPGLVHPGVAHRRDRIGSRSSTST